MSEKIHWVETVGFWVTDALNDIKIIADKIAKTLNKKIERVNCIVGLFDKQRTKGLALAKLDMKRAHPGGPYKDSNIIAQNYFP